MGFADRDYARPASTPRSSLLGRGSGAPVVRSLVILNAAIFLFSPGLFPSQEVDSPSSQFFYAGVLQPLLVVQEAQWWRLFSCMFLHVDLLHILFNLFVLSQFGPQLEKAFGSLRFLIFYLLCGLAGSLMIVGFAYWIEPDLIERNGVGASGAIYGVMFALAVLVPNQRIMLMIPPIPMKLRTYALVMVALGVFVVSDRSWNYGGELAHLGGGFLGALLAWKPELLGLTRAESNNSPKRVREFRGRSIQEAQIVDETQSQEQQVIDRILDKISSQGIDSLSEEERKALDEYREQLKK